MWVSAALLSVLLFGLSAEGQVGAGCRFLFFLSVYASAYYLVTSKPQGYFGDHSRLMLWNVAIFFSCFVGLAMNNKLGGVLKWLLAFVLFVSLVSWGGVYSDKNQ